MVFEYPLYRSADKAVLIVAQRRNALFNLLSRAEPAKSPHRRPTNACVLVGQPGREELKRLPVPQLAKGTSRLCTNLRIRVVQGGYKWPYRRLIAEFSQRDSSGPPFSAVR